MSFTGKKLSTFVFVVALVAAAACRAPSPQLRPSDAAITEQSATLSVSAVTRSTTDTTHEPRCDVICQDATAAARITPGSPATNSPLYYEHERQYRERLEATQTAQAAATPTPTDTPPLATPSATPEIEVYQGRSYASRTQPPPDHLQVRFATADWTREDSTLHNRRLTGCTLLLLGGAREAAGPVQITFISLGGYSWRRLVDHGGHAIYYWLDLGDRSYLIEADLPGDTQSADSMECQESAEEVLATFQLVED